MSVTSTMLSLKSAEEQEWKELYTYIIMLEHREKELKWFNDILEKQNLDKAKEIERLKNIINELEKWLESEIKRIEELQNPAKSKVKPYGEEYNNYTLIIGAYDNALDKLQELKGSESNENL